MNRYKARELSEQYQHLVGSPFMFTNNDWDNIECVTISPYDEINKWVFIHHYKDEGCPKKALEFYKVPFYDVILIARKKVNNAIVHYRNLSGYLMEGNLHLPPQFKSHIA